MCQKDGTHQGIGGQGDAEKEGKTARIVVFCFKCLSPITLFIFLREQFVLIKQGRGTLFLGLGAPRGPAGRNRGPWTPDRALGAHSARGTLAEAQSSHRASQTFCGKSALLKQTLGCGGSFALNSEAGGRLRAGKLKSADPPALTGCCLGQRRTCVRCRPRTGWTVATPTSPPSSAPVGAAASTPAPTGCPGASRLCRTQVSGPRARRPPWVPGGHARPGRAPSAAAVRRRRPQSGLCLLSLC